MRLSHFRFTLWKMMTAIAIVGAMLAIGREMLSYVLTDRDEYWLSRILGGVAARVPSGGVEDPRPQ